MLGDKAYDSAELRNDLDERGTNPVIPNKSNRKQPFRFNKRLHKLRWRIEAAFNRLKDFRRIATRYDKLARNYLASVCLVAALVWWIYESGPSRGLSTTIAADVARKREWLKQFSVAASTRRRVQRE